MGQFITHHWQLSVAFIIIFVIIFVNEYVSAQKQNKSVSVEQAIDQMNHHNATIIDIRSADLFKKGHILNAIRANEDDFKLPKMNQYKDKALIIVCSRGIQANLVATKLRAQGFTQTMVLAGGIEAWQNANMPLVKK